MDRVGVIRRLAIGDTLIQAEGEWKIDLTKFRHKTSKFYGVCVCVRVCVCVLLSCRCCFYHCLAAADEAECLNGAGPSITTLSSVVSVMLETFLRLEGRMPGEGSFEFTERDAAVNRADKEYLFHAASGVTYAYSPSHWTSRVKDAFRRHSPERKAVPPKLLRSSFIVALRDAKSGCPDVLKSAANSMKHSVATQGSNVYDAKTHDRLNALSFAWCAEFASRFEEGGGGAAAGGGAAGGGGAAAAAAATAGGEGGEGGEEEDAGCILDEDGGFDVDLDESLHTMAGSESADESGSAKASGSAKRSTPLAPPPRIAQKPRKKGKACGGEMTVRVGDPIARACAPTGADSDTEGQIKLIRAAEVTVKGVQFDIVWEGHEHLSEWWQGLEQAMAKEVLITGAECTVKGHIVEMEVRGEGKPLCCVVADIGENEWQLHTANGTELRIMPHQCCFGDIGSTGELMAWKLRPEGLGVRTDHAMDWRSTPELQQVRVRWGCGHSFPAFDESKTVLLALQQQEIYTMDDNAEEVDTLAQICAFLDKPHRDHVLMMRFNCTSLLRGWLPGSLVRDALKVLASVEPHHVAVAKKKQKKQQQEEEEEEKESGAQQQQQEEEEEEEEAAAVAQQQMPMPMPSVEVAATPNAAAAARKVSEASSEPPRAAACNPTVAALRSTSGTTMDAIIAASVAASAAGGLAEAESTTSSTDHAMPE